MKQIKIAVSGKFGSGKNLFLDIAQNYFPELQFKEAKFAQPIYDAVSAIQSSLGLSQCKDGAILQFLGEHYRNQYDENFWVDRFFRKVTDSSHIVTDVRYPSELHAVTVNDYITIRIHRKAELRANNQGNRDFKHISETALDVTSDTMFDYTINNNGSLELFKGAVISIIQRILNEN